MKKTFLLSILAAISISLSAQVNSATDTVMSRFFQLEQLTGEKYMDAGHRNIGMYFIEDWTPGKIVLISGEEIDNIYLHYNGFQDQLLWLKDKTVQITLDKYNISEFYLKYLGITYHFKKMKIKLAKDSIDTYCQDLYDGKAKLMVVRRSILESELVKYYELFYTYSPKPVYCLFIGNNIYILRNARIRSLYRAFPLKKDSIRARIKQLHLKGRKEADFVKIVQGIEDILLI